MDVLKENLATYLISNVIAVFCIQIGFSVADMVLVMNPKGMEEGIPEAVLMFVLALISSILLQSFFLTAFKALKK